MEKVQKLQSDKSKLFVQNNQNINQIDTEFQIIKNKKNFTVAVRIKPELTSETNLVSLSVRPFSSQSDELRLNYDGKKYEYNTYGQSSQRKFVFDKVFESKTQNSQIFQSLIEKKLQFLKRGVNLSIMAYGATNSGKTYTIFGKRSESQKCGVLGLSYLTLKRVFEIYSSQYNLTFSFVQIYNENIYDLLNTTLFTSPLNVMQDSEGNNNIIGLNKVELKSAEQLENLINQGNQARISSSNVHNMFSSRSHAFMELQLKHKLTKIRTRIVIVDLAGSQKYVYNALNAGILLKQGSNINKSLLSLGNCIKSLYENEQHVPYRDSKLTRLLKQNLNGYAHNIMIACINKKANNFEQNLNSLSYASKAIKIQKQINRKIQSDQVSQYQCTSCQQKLPYSLIKQINKHEEHKKRVKTRESQSLSISPISKNSNQVLSFKSQNLNSSIRTNFEFVKKLVEQSFENLQKQLQNTLLTTQDFQAIIQRQKNKLVVEMNDQILNLKTTTQKEIIERTQTKKFIVSQFESPKKETISPQQQILTWKQSIPAQKKVKISLSKPKKQLQNTAATDQTKISMNNNSQTNNKIKYSTNKSHIKIQDYQMDNFEQVNSFRSNLTVQILDDKDKILNERKKVLEQTFNQRKKNNHSINLINFKSSQRLSKNKDFTNLFNSQPSQQLQTIKNQSNKENFIRIEENINEIKNFDDFLINQKLLDSTCMAPRMRRDDQGTETWKNIFIKNVESPTNIFLHFKQKPKFEESFVEECITFNTNNSQLMRVFRHQKQCLY